MNWSKNQSDTQLPFFFLFPAFPDLVHVFGARGLCLCMCAVFLLHPPPLLTVFPFFSLLAWASLLVHFLRVLAELTGHGLKGRGGVSGEVGM